VFKLADLKKLYIDRLQQLDPCVVHTVNSTRLKERLLLHFPDGRVVVLAFDDRVGTALSKACSSDVDDDAMHLARAAEIVRRDLFNNTWQFDGSLSQGSQEKSIPQALLTLVKMILEGPSIDIQLPENHKPSAFGCSNKTTGRTLCAS